MQYDEIKRLINDVGNSNIDDISLEFPDGLKINIKKNSSEVNTIVNNVIPSSKKHIELHRDMGHYGRNLKGGEAQRTAIRNAAKKAAK